MDENKPYPTDGTSIGQPRLSWNVPDRVGHIADSESYARSKNKVYRRRIAQQIKFKKML